MIYNATSQWVTECDAHLCFLQNVKTSLELDINFTISQLNVAFMISIWRWPCVFRICMVDIILRWSKESNCWKSYWYFIPVHCIYVTSNCTLAEKYKRPMGHIAHMSSCKSVALRSLKVGMGDQRATVPPIVKTAYLMRRKSCARFRLHFSRYLLCQVKKTDKINTRHV